jgi:hypothetical protein
MLGDQPAFVFIADESPLHRKLGVYEVSGDHHAGEGLRRCGKDQPVQQMGIAAGPAAPDPAGSAPAGRPWRQAPGPNGRSRPRGGRRPAGGSKRRARWTVLPARWRPHCAGAAAGAGRIPASAVLRASAGDLAVRAQRQRHARGQPARQVAQAVAQVGFGAGAQHHAGAAGGHGVDLLRRGVGGVHQLPARIQRQFAASAIRSGGRRWRPGSRPPRRSVRPCGCGWALRRRTAHTARDRRGRRRTQRVDGHTGIHRGRRRRARRRAAPAPVPRVAKRRWSSRSAAGRSRRVRTAPAAASGRCRLGRGLGQCAWLMASGSA